MTDQASNQTNEQAANVEHNTKDPKAAQSNIERDETILEETIDEFDPANNSGEDKTIKSEIDLEAFQARIAELEDEVKTAKEGQARANAEAYNVQKRMEQEAQKSKKFALQGFAKELLEVVDNLERAIISVQQDDDADDAILQGVKLTHKSLLTVLNKNGVAVVDPQGEKFNADLHEAVGIDPDAEADHVGEVLQKGYTLNDRLLRPAMVRVGQ